MHSIAFSYDGTRVVSGSLDRTVRIWDATTGSEVLTLKHPNTVLSVAFSPDGQHIASGSSDKTVRIWDAIKGRELSKLEGHRNNVSAVVFSPNSRLITSGSSDRTVIIWYVIERVALFQPLQGHASAIESLAFSADGSQIISKSSGNTILYDAASGRRLQPTKPLARAFGPPSSLVRVVGSSTQTLTVPFANFLL